LSVKSGDTGRIICEIKFDVAQIMISVGPLHQRQTDDIWWHYPSRYCIVRVTTLRKRGYSLFRAIMPMRLHWFLFP